MIYGTEEFDDLLIEILKRGYRHSAYDETVEHAKEMSWHFFGVTPDELLNRARPNEDPAITAYRTDNYEPTTKAEADKAVTVTSKVFNPNLSSIRWETDTKDTKEIRDYTLEYYPEYNSVVNFTKDVLLRKMLSDPNGLVITRPLRIPTGQSDRLEPVMVIFGSSAIYNFDLDHYLICISEDEDKQRSTNTGVFEYYDKSQYLKIEVEVKTKGGKEELTITVLETYVYQFDSIPAWRLRGMSESKDNGAIIYKSFFYSAVPYWNLAIIHESDLFGAYIRHLFPQRYELSEQCQYKMEWDGMMFPCRGGKIRYGSADDDGGVMACPHCGGSGWEPIGPLGVYRYVKEKLQEAGPLGVDPVGYITVPVDATKMLEERVDKLKKKGMYAINMDVEDQVGEIQSGVAKQIDRSAQYDMLYDIGTTVFDVHLNNYYYYADQFMFGVENQSTGKKSKTLPQINKPTQFDILSSAELVNNYKVAKDSGLDPNFLQIKQQEILSKDLTTNPDLKLFSTMLLDLDPLPGMADMVVRSNVMAGFNSKDDAIIHFNLKQFVERAIRDNAGFIGLTKDRKLEILVKYAKEFSAANKIILTLPDYGQASPPQA